MTDLQKHYIEVYACCFNNRKTFDLYIDLVEAVFKRYRIAFCQQNNCKIKERMLKFYNKKLTNLQMSVVTEKTCKVCQNTFLEDFIGMEKCQLCLDERLKKIDSLTDVKSLRKEFAKIMTRNLRIELYTKFNNCCILCYSKEKLSVDHIVPLTKGGTNEWSNFQVLCRSCNSKIGNRTYYVSSAG